MPPQPKTLEIPRVEVPGNTLDAVLLELRAMRGETSERFDRLETTVDTLVEDGKSANQRMTRIELRMDSFEERAKNNSIRVRGTSENDLKQDAAIAQVITRQDAHEKKLDAVGKQVNAVEKKTDEQTVMLKDIRDTVVGVVTNKKVIFVGKVIFAIAVAYSGLHGLKVLP